MLSANRRERWGEGGESVVRILPCLPSCWFCPAVPIISPLPLCLRIAGITDKTCKLWNAENGDLYHTYRGHTTEIVCLSFNPHGTVVATGSMDNSARLWDVETGECLHSLLGHTAEIVSLNFDTQGGRIITGSFDHTVKIWDVRNGRCIHTLSGHHGEISSTQVGSYSFGAGGENMDEIHP